MAMTSGGVQDSSLGIDYQLDLLLLCAHQSDVQKIKFELSTEQANAGKFDDIVLTINENGKIRHVFGQAKHRVKAGYLLFKTLMENRIFKLSKYFDSWREILSEKQFENGEKTILIITLTLCRLCKTDL
jgi:hypothetical protein